MLSREEIKQRIASRGLKVTSQRIAVYEAIVSTETHPTAEWISQQLAKDHPSIALGTVYKVLDSFEQTDLVRRVKTEGDTMRYDARTGGHHHLYDPETQHMRDYFDDELSSLIENYFKQKNIQGFEMKEIHIQLEGHFTKPLNDTNDEN